MVAGDAVHMDEYMGIAEDDPASFRKFLREHVAARVHPKASTRCRASDQPIGECDRYEALLRAQWIDAFVVLDRGENGHVRV